jgi:MMPL family
MVVGPQSESYRTLRSLVQRLPAMIAPAWLKNATQPLTIDDTLSYLIGALAVDGSAGREIQIGGPDVLTYGEMLDGMAEVLDIRRRPRIPVPLITPWLSSLWIGLVTPVDAGVARPLIEGLAVPTVVTDRSGMALFDIEPISFGRVVRGPLPGCAEERGVLVPSGVLGIVRELTLAKHFPSGERFAAITVVRRDGGLKSRDLAAIERTRASLAAQPPVTGSRQVLVRVSPDRTTALVIVNLNPRGKETLLKSSVSGVESRVAPLRARGLTVRVTGPAGFSRDAVNVFASINGTLLLATGALVFVLLILIYRSPIFWVIPLFSVVMAEAFSRFCGWAIAEAGSPLTARAPASCPCSYSVRAPTMRCCLSRATARSCADTSARSTRCARRCGGPDPPCLRRGRRSSRRCCAYRWHRSTAPAGSGRSARWEWRWRCWRC